VETHSISAGLDYPGSYLSLLPITNKNNLLDFTNLGVGPELAWLKDTNRAEFYAATDEECLRGFRMCAEYEGIIPALETAHAIWQTVKMAKDMPKDANIVMVRFCFRKL